MGPLWFYTCTEAVPFASACFSVNTSTAHCSAYVSCMDSCCRSLAALCAHVFTESELDAEWRVTHHTQLIRSYFA
jgi:hypothetical protein